MVESVDTPDLKSVGHCARGSSSLPTRISKIKNMLTNICQTSFYWHFRAPNAEEILKKIEEYSEKDADNSRFSWTQVCIVDLVPLLAEDWIDLIKPNLDHISNIMNVNCEYILYDPWLNFYKRHSFQEVHDHDSFDMSYVFFANDGKDFSKFSFFDRNSTSLTSLMKEFCGYSSGTHIDYKKGDILFFPSNLLHHVTPHNSDEVRKTLSGNITFTDVYPK